MPYSVTKDNPECGADAPYAVIKDGSGEVMGCHESEDSAQDQIAAIMAEEGEAEDSAERDLIRTHTIISRQADGTYRWISRSCTAVLNRVWEIDSRKLFDSLIQYAEVTGEYPYRTLYHLGPEFAYGQCDLMVRDGYVLITSGTYDLDGPNADLARAEIESAQGPDADLWGESIRYAVTAPPNIIEVHGMGIAVFTEGIPIEISFVLEEHAAAFYTNRNVEVDMGKQLRNALSLLNLSKARKDQIEEEVDGVNRAIIDNPDTIARTPELEQEPEPAEIQPEEVDPVEDPEPEPGFDPELVFDEVDLGDGALVLSQEGLEDLARHMVDQAEGQLAEQFAKLTGQLTQILDALGDYSARLEVLEQGDQERMTRYQQDMPRRTREPVVALYRPRAAAAAEEEPEETFADKATQVLNEKVMPKIHKG